MANLKQLKFWLTKRLTRIRLSSPINSTLAIQVMKIYEKIMFLEKKFIFYYGISRSNVYMTL